MDHAGLLGFLPPVLAIVLALVTKDVTFSLFSGIFAGALMIAQGNPVFAFLHITDLFAQKISDSWNIRIFLFCGLLGGLVGLLGRAGAAAAFGHGAGRFIKGPKSAQLCTWLFGLMIFIDDYFNTMSVGSVMRPITDKNKVSRAKLAYILDSTAAPVCIIMPISSWVVTVLSQIRESARFGDLGINEMAFFIRLIPYNLYSIFALLLVLVVALSGFDFGRMAQSEAAAKKGKLYDEEKYGPASGVIEAHEEAEGARWFDMLVPMLALILSCVIAFPSTAYMALEAGQTITLSEAFRHADASAALLYGVVFSLVFAYVYFLIRRVLTIKLASEGIIDGIKSMVPALSILALAWTIGHIISSPLSGGGLGLPLFLDTAIKGSSFPLPLLPICAFLLAGLIAFSTGTSWGTFGIMIPIVLPLAIALAENRGLAGENLMHAALINVSAVLSGAVFGDHASPISDTTILSSAGAGCPHLEHVSTQMSYALFAAVCAFAGIIAGGFTLNPLIAFSVSLAVFLVGFFLFFRPLKNGGLA